jgi:hypothetical protein
MFILTFRRSFCFDPFLDLSVPIPKKHGNKSKWRRQFSLKEQAKCPLEECIEKFAGDSNINLSVFSLFIFKLCKVLIM